MARYVVGKVSELPPGSRRIVPVGGARGIGVFNVGGAYYALRNVCPHQAGPVCLGLVTGTTRARDVPGAPPETEWVREGEILRCPWHGWEFEISTGRMIFRPGRRIKSYDVHVEAPAEMLAQQGSPDRLDTFPVHVEDGVVILEY